jgi:membrane protease YdiL (CAAX protease family)
LVARGRAALVALGILFAILLVSEAVRTWVWLNAMPQPIVWLVQPVLAVALIFAGLWWLYRRDFRWMLRELGLTGSLIVPIVFAALATLPLAIGFGFGDRPLANLSVWSLVFTMTVWPFAWELIFRGYAFRQLHRRAGWGFFTAALVPPLVFAVVHLAFAFFADQDLRIPLLAAGAALLGGLFFSWLFVAWGDNLWPGVAFHGLLNFWWEGFGIDRAGIGTLGSNLLRGAAVVLAVLLTLYWQRLPWVRRNRVAAAEGAHTP